MQSIDGARTKPRRSRIEPKPWGRNGGPTPERTPAMNRIAKLVAPVALFAAFGVANAGEVAPRDINLKPVMAGSATVATGKIVGAPSGEGVFGTFGKVVTDGTVPPATQFAGERIEQPLVSGA
jgi:hypothetical protein